MQSGLPIRTAQMIHDFDRDLGGQRSDFDPGSNGEALEVHAAAVAIFQRKADEIARHDRRQDAQPRRARIEQGFDEPVADLDPDAVADDTLAHLGLGDRDVVAWRGQRRIGGRRIGGQRIEGRLRSGRRLGPSGVAARLKAKTMPLSLHKKRTIETSLRVRGAARGLTKIERLPERGGRRPWLPPHSDSAWGHDENPPSTIRADPLVYRLRSDAR